MGFAALNVPGAWGQKERGGKKMTAPSIPKRSHTQVLTRPDPALLLRSDEIGCVQGGMVIDDSLNK